jgi:hypothetical protein
VIQSGLAAIKGVPAGTKVVVEGAQNVRKDSIVAEGGPAKGGGAGKSSDAAESRKGTGNEGEPVKPGAGGPGKPGAAGQGAAAAKP